MLEGNGNEVDRAMARSRGRLVRLTAIPNFLLALVFGAAGVFLLNWSEAPAEILVFGYPVGTFTAGVIGLLVGAVFAVLGGRRLAKASELSGNR